jgi:pyruvate kinase
MVDAVRRTKLVCTLGPASAALVPELVAAGMDVARVNFSHGTPSEHAAAVAAVRGASAAVGREVGILVDLPGPKIRLGELAGGAIDLEAGARFILRPGSDDAGDAGGAAVTYPRLGHDVRVGDRILLADGAAELRVTATGETVLTTVVRGGSVRSRAGVAIPADRLTEPPLTPRDIAALPRVLALGADFVGQSFVRRASDIRELRERLGPTGPSIVAKIETRPAVDDFEAILEAADAVMIARGDLGVELPFEDVPLVQKQLVRRALDRGIPSIVATQMLESMTRSPRPTRAEASDVANAVFDGADAIMLSGETAIGAYPVLAAEAAVGIARACEQRGGALLPPGAHGPADGDGDALAVAAVALTEADPGIVAIACFTRTGRTARAVSKLRPKVPVIAFASEASVVRRLAVADGVVPRICPPPSPDVEPVAFVVAALAPSGLVHAGERVVILASTGPLAAGPDVLAVHRIVGEAEQGRAGDGVA